MERTPLSDLRKNQHLPILIRWGISSLLFLFIILFISVTANAQTWNNIGIAGFSTGVAENTSIAIDASGTPYVVYIDFANGKKTTVMKYSGSNWVTVGNAGFSAGRANYPSLAIDGTGTVYVAYADVVDVLGSYGPATVMKYNGSNWVTVGTAGFSAGEAYWTTIAIDIGGTPYVVYGDSVNNDKTTVMKYDGGKWVTVGSAGFSIGSAAYQSIAIDGGGTPYVVYTDSAYGYRATVMKYNGSSWVIVGSPGFSAGQVETSSIAIDGSGAPYVVYTDFVNGYKATAMKFDGSSWVTVGSPGFSAGGAWFNTIAISKAGMPYVAYSDYNFADRKATVMKYNGVNWEVVGSTGFSSGEVYDISIAINNDGIPYVVYTDDANGGKATAMKFGSGTGVKIANGVTASLAYPNPNSGSFTLQLPQINDRATIILTNTLGTIIETRTIENTQPQNINFDLHVPPGTYIVKVSFGENTWREKIQVW